MQTLKEIEEKMIKWQSGIRILYKDLQSINNWTDEQAWKEVENELKRITTEGEFGEDDLAWLREIITSKREITLWEAVICILRFEHSTPLLDALGNLRARNISGT